MKNIDIMETIRQEYIEGISLRKLEKKYNVNRKVLSNKLKNEGVSIRSTKPDLTVDRNKILFQYKNGKSLRQLEKENNISRQTIARYCIENKVNIRRIKRNVNQNVFDDLNEESLYWLGFILADGSVSSIRGKGHYLHIGLAIIDFDHLEKFKNFIRTDTNVVICKNERCCYIHISNKYLVEKLGYYNIIPRKSWCATVNPLLENSRDFWRGCIDGDGSLYYSKGLPWIALCGTYEIINIFLKFIKNNGIITNAKPSCKADCNFCDLRFCGYNAIKIVKILYEGCDIYLNRKYILAKKFFQLDGNYKQIKLKNVVDCEKSYSKAS